jgi:hypothetical protein
MTYAFAAPKPRIVASRNGHFGEATPEIGSATARTAASVRASGILLSTATAPDSLATGTARASCAPVSTPLRRR